MTEVDLQGVYTFIKEICVIGGGVGVLFWRGYTYVRDENEKLHTKFDTETQKISEANLSGFKICNASLEDSVKEINEKIEKNKEEAAAGRGRIYDRIDEIKLANTRDFISKEIFENERKHHNEMIDQKLAGMVQLFTAQITNINNTLVKIETTVNKLVDNKGKNE